VQTLQSDTALQVLHDFVAERQGGDTSFTFIVPGPPGLRQELGEEKMAMSLEELGLAPAASLTVQATSKKDLVTVAPEGSQFVSAHARGMGMMRGGMMGGMAQMPMGMRMHGSRGRTLASGDEVEDDDGEEEGQGEQEEDDDDEDPMDTGMEGIPATAEEEEAALAHAQTASMDMATEAHFSRGRLGGIASARAGMGAGHVLGGQGEGDGRMAEEGSRLGGGEAKCVLDKGTIASINALDLSKVRIPGELLDPLTQQLMMDPVKLPSSGSTMDRSTIMRHLSTNPTDPYTNTQLDPRNLAPAIDLLPKYKAWLARCQK